MKSHSRQGNLRQTVLDLEFIIISVVQGVALTFLGENSSRIITNLQYEYWFYLGSGFILILLFWSGAIIHALSFVDWPPDLIRNFLYFLTSFIEILVFSQLNNPLGWYSLTFIFFIVAGILYFHDLSVIKKEQHRFLKTTEKKLLHEHILRQQLFELKFLIPGGLVFSTLSIVLLVSDKNLFLKNHYHVFLSLIQFIFSLGLLFSYHRSFKIHANLIKNFQEY